MHNGHLVEHAHPWRRTLATAVIALLVLGIALGAVIGIGMSQAFDRLDIEKRARDFSNPAAAPVTQPR